MPTGITAQGLEKRRAQSMAPPRPTINNSDHGEPWASSGANLEGSAMRTLATGSLPHDDCRVVEEHDKADAVSVGPGSPRPHTPTDVSPTGAIPSTPPKTMAMEADLLFRHESESPRCSPAETATSCSSTIMAANKDQGEEQVTPMSPGTPRVPGVFPDRPKAHPAMAQGPEAIDGQRPQSGRPRQIPFITCTPEGMLRVHPAAAMELDRREEAGKGIRVLTIFGAPRSGKSTLVERGLLQLGPEHEDPDWLPGCGGGEVGGRGCAMNKEGGCPGSSLRRAKPPLGGEPSLPLAESQALSAGRSQDKSPRKSGHGSAQDSNSDSESPALSRGVVLWLWSTPVAARQRQDMKPDRMIARPGSSMSSRSNSSVSSFSSGGGVSVGGSPQVGRANTATPLDDVGEELVEVTVLESGSFGIVDESVVLALCVLLSSHLVYNGVGLLDAARIQHLTSIRALPNLINTHVDSAIEEDGLGFREHFPRLSWLLRDCDAQLIDERRHFISASAYLERALKVRGFSDEAEEKNMIRKMIASFFPEQDLHVLPTPAPIPGLPLGERFLSKLTPVCGALLGAVPVKQILGRNLDSAMLLDVARNYVADVNATLPFCIPKAYDHMCLSRCKLAVQRAQGHYAKQRQTFRACLPTSDAALAAWHSKTSAEAHHVLAVLAGTDVEVLRTELDASLLQLHSEIEGQNQEASRVAALLLLESLYARCEQQVLSGDISSLEMYELERNKVRREFEAQSRDLAQYTCRMTMLEFMECRLLRFSRSMLKGGSTDHDCSVKSSIDSSVRPSCYIKGFPSQGQSNKDVSPSRLPRNMTESASSSGATELQGEWVKREVLEYVKRKAKSDLEDLENELMGVILAMEDEMALTQGHQSPACHLKDGQECRVDSMSDGVSVEGSTVEIAGSVEDPRRPARRNKQAMTMCNDTPETTDAVTGTLFGICEDSLHQEWAPMDCVDFASPVSLAQKSESGDSFKTADSEEESSAKEMGEESAWPAALEAALDAAAMSAPAPWTAAVTAAVNAAQDDDNEAWKVAMEAAIEVATEHVVSSQTRVLRERLLNSDSPRRVNSVPTKSICLAPCIPASQPVAPADGLQELKEAVEEAERSLLLSGSAPTKSCHLKTAAPTASALPDHMLISEMGGDVSRGSGKIKSARLSRALAMASPRACDSSFATSPGPSPHTAWLKALGEHAVEEATNLNSEAGETACRSIEAEIIRRCILQNAPHRERTPISDTPIRIPSLGTPSSTPYDFNESDNALDPVGQQSALVQASGIAHTGVFTKEDTQAKRAYTRADLSELVIDGEIFNSIKQAHYHSPSESTQHAGSCEPAGFLANGVVAQVTDEGRGVREGMLVSEPPAKTHEQLPFSQALNALCGKPSAFASPRTKSEGGIVAPPRKDSRVAEGTVIGDAIFKVPAADVSEDSRCKQMQARVLQVRKNPPPDGNTEAACEASTRFEARKISMDGTASDVTSANTPRKGLGKLGVHPAPSPQIGSRLGTPELRTLVSSVDASPVGTRDKQVPLAVSVRSLKKPVSSRKEMTAGPLALSLPCSHPSHMTSTTTEAAATTLPEQESTKPRSAPPKGQLFLDGEELVMPDPALYLLHCQCRRIVSMVPPDGTGLVNVCIDCGSTHKPVAS